MGSEPPRWCACSGEERGGEGAIGGCQEVRVFDGNYSFFMIGFQHLWIIVGKDWCERKRKATARVPAHHPPFPRLYYDYGGLPATVHSRGGGGCGAEWGPLPSSLIQSVDVRSTVRVSVEA